MLHAYHPKTLTKTQLQEIKLEVDTRIKSLGYMQQIAVRMVPIAREVLEASNWTVGEIVNRLADAGFTEDRVAIACEKLQGVGNDFAKCKTASEVWELAQALVKKTLTENGVT